MALTFKATNRFRVKYEDPKLGLIFDTYASGITKEECKRRVEEQGYILISIGEIEER